MSISFLSLALVKASRLSLVIVVFHRRYNPRVHGPLYNFLIKITLNHEDIEQDKQGLRIKCLS